MQGERGNGSEGGLEDSDIWRLKPSIKLRAESSFRCSVRRHSCFLPSLAERANSVLLPDILSHRVLRDLQSFHPYLHSAELGVRSTRLSPPWTLAC